MTVGSPTVSDAFHFPQRDSWAGHWAAETLSAIGDPSPMMGAGIQLGNGVVP